MAIVLLTTAGIGTLSMMFALHDGVHTPLAVAVIGGLVWGFIILNLDRFLVLSMGHSRDLKRLLLMALPRLGLAAVISMVVATPMTLRIFASDIQQQMVQVNANESKQVAKQQLQSGPATQAAAILTEINTDKQIMAGHLQGTVSNPQVTFWQDKVNTLTPQVQQAQTAMDKAQAAYQCEVDGSGPGCEGASDNAGNGPMAQLKKTEFEQAQQKFQRLNTQLQSAQQNLQAAQSAAEKASGQTLQQQTGSESRASRPAKAVQPARSPAEEERGTGAGRGGEQYRHPRPAPGPVGRRSEEPDAQRRSVDRHPAVLLHRDPPGDGQGAAQHRPVVHLRDLAQERGGHHHRPGEAHPGHQAPGRREGGGQAGRHDQHMRQLEEDLGKKANTHVAQHMEAILDVALADWSRQVQAKLGVQLPPGSLPGPTGTVSGQVLPGSPGGFGAPGAPGGTGASAVRAPPAARPSTSPARSRG